MDLYQLDCFRMVARTEHISNAAVILHITQPALSKIISRVEDYAGAPLFDRVKGKIRLNETGTAFLATLDEMFDILQKGKKEVMEISTRTTNQIRLAASSDSILFMLAETFFSEHPEVRIHYSVLDQEHIREAFLRNALDFALTTYPVQEKGVEWERLGEEEIVMLVGSASPFFGRKSISFAELRGVEVMCENNGGDLRNAVNKCYEAAGIAPNIVLESTTGSVMGFKHGLNRAVSFAPIHRFMQMCQAHFSMPPELQVHGLRLTGPKCTWVSGIAHRPVQLMNPATEDFYYMAKDYFERLHQEMVQFGQDYFGH